MGLNFSTNRRKRKRPSEDGGEPEAESPPLFSGDRICALRDGKLWHGYVCDATACRPHKAKSKKTPKTDPNPGATDSGICVLWDGKSKKETLARDQSHLVG